MDQNYGQQPNRAPIPGGQQAGIAVTVPPGSMLRIRINRGLDSNHIQRRRELRWNRPHRRRCRRPSGHSARRDRERRGRRRQKGRRFQGSGRAFPADQQRDARRPGLSADHGGLGSQTGRDKTPGTVGNTVGTRRFWSDRGRTCRWRSRCGNRRGRRCWSGLAGSAAIASRPDHHSARVGADLQNRGLLPTVKTVSEQEMERLSYQAGPPQPNGPPRVRYYSPYYGYYYGPPR